MIIIHRLIIFILPPLGMILSSESICSRLGRTQQEGGIIIRPYSESSQQPASYDLRSTESAIIKKESLTLIASKEWVELPSDLAATIRCRSSFARRGIFLSGGFVDPGFRGHLTLCLFNCGGDDISVQEGERVVQMVFHEVNGTCTEYSGRYQDSQGVVLAR